MSNRWTDILDQAGDRNLGTTLIRLARLAESAHRHQAAERLKSSFRADGSAPRPLPPVHRGVLHTEVNA